MNQVVFERDQLVRHRVLKVVGYLTYNRYQDVLEDGTIMWSLRYRDKESGRRIEVPIQISDVEVVDD